MLTRREVDITIRCTRKQVCPRMGKLAIMGFQRRKSNPIIHGFDENGTFFKTKVEFTDDETGRRFTGLKSLPWVATEGVVN